jgi:sterol 3beta-glucosyltransferase
MPKNKARGPFHMNEIDGDVPILPAEGADVKAEDQPENATFVDIGTIQTNPKISQQEFLMHFIA